MPKADRPAAIERAVELFPVLGERRRQTAGTLSGGEQQMLSLARVLTRQPRLLIADEISLGLAPLIVEEVFAGLQRVIELASPSSSSSSSSTAPWPSRTTATSCAAAVWCGAARPPRPAPSWSNTTSAARTEPRT